MSVVKIYHDIHIKYAYNWNEIEYKSDTIDVFSIYINEQDHFIFFL